MKKILNILVSVSLVISGAGNVVACGSTQTSPPPNEITNLYNQLNQTTKPFLLNKDNYFWGKEANYKNDLLGDLEKVANIPPKDDSLLSLNSDIPPLEKTGVQTIDVNIGSQDTEKIAIVKIDWELTKAQEPIYQFYTQTWPEETTKYRSNLLSFLYGEWDKTKISPYWKQYDFLGWWQNGNAVDSINHVLPWNDSLNKGIKSYISNLIEGAEIPISIQNMINVVKPSTINSLDITKSYTIPTDSIYLLSHGVKYNLGYYSSYDKTKALSKMQNWKVNYDTYYNLAQNELKNYKDVRWKTHVWYIQEPNTKTSDASSEWNNERITDLLERTPFAPLVNNDLTFQGSLVVTTDLTKPIINKIDVYYDGVSLGFQIPIVASLL